MDDPLNSIPPEPPPDPPAPPNYALVIPVHEYARPPKAIVRRLLTLLATALTAFSFTTWLLVRHDAQDANPEENSAAAGVVRAQLDALNKGELRAAYELFSDHYRQQVPFDAFHELVAAHWAMFRAREIKFENRENSRVRAVLDTHILASNGERYLARYTVVEVEGHWFIDDVRWGIESQDQGRSIARIRLQLGGVAHRTNG